MRAQASLALQLELDEESKKPLRRQVLEAAAMAEDADAGLFFNERWGWSTV